MTERLAVPASFRSVDDVVGGLAALDCHFRSARDRRGLFVIAYIAITHTIAQWIVRGVFQDGAAMTRHVVAFANEYRRSLADSAAGKRSFVPMAWQQFFDACSESRGIFQCLMLGINAHMKRDLPYAVIAAGIDVDCSNCYEDYVLIDDALRLNIPLVRRRIADAYGAELPLGQRWFGHFASARIHHEFTCARKNAWEHAQRLARAESEAARARVDRMIEEHAAAQGRKILY